MNATKDGKQIQSLVHTQVKQRSKLLEFPGDWEGGQRTQSSTWGTGEESELGSDIVKTDMDSLLKNRLTPDRRASGSVVVPNMLFPVRVRIGVCGGPSLNLLLFAEQENQYWIRKKKILRG